MSEEETTSVQGVMHCVSEELTAEVEEKKVKDWWDEEVQAAIQERKRLNRDWRRLLRDIRPDPVQIEEAKA